MRQWPLNIWWISNKAIMEAGNITKAATFKSFLHLSYKYTQLPFCDNDKILIDDFWGLHENMNCAFPLRYSIVRGSRWLVFGNVDVLQNCSTFTGKHLCRSIFLINLQARNLKHATLLKKWLQHRYSRVNFLKFLRTLFFMKHFRVTDV